MSKALIAALSILVGAIVFTNYVGIEGPGMAVQDDKSYVYDADDYPIRLKIASDVEPIQLSKDSQDASYVVNGVPWLLVRSSESEDPMHTIIIKTELGSHVYAWFEGMPPFEITMR